MLEAVFFGVKLVRVLHVRDFSLHHFFENSAWIKAHENLIRGGSLMMNKTKFLKQFLRCVFLLGSSPSIF